MNKSLTFLIIIILLSGITFGIIKMNNQNKVKIETNYGDIIIELYPDKAPITVENFKTYVEEDFYSNTIFHRVIDGFMIQGGGFDANTGIEKQTHESIKLESNNGLKNEKGTIAMARTIIPDSATSQFFINTKDNDFLNYGVRDEGYTVFGKVTKGMDVVYQIERVETDSNDVPLEKVIIKNVEII